MAIDIKTEILIHASPSKVWAVLTDFENHPNWNPFIRSIKGNVKVGNPISVRIEPPDGKGMTFNPTVLVFNENKEFRWIGKFLFKGLFDGEHKFELIDKGNGKTIFIHSEMFSGILVPVFKKQLEKSTKKGFELMNEHLKEQAEK